MRAGACRSGKACGSAGPILASKISSAPEVGGAFADYCAPHDEEDIHAALSRLIFDAAYRDQRVAAIRQANLRCWRDVAQDLAAQGDERRAKPGQIDADASEKSLIRVFLPAGGSRP